MTTEHLIAWIAENLLASVFIGSGALLLATWPIRAMWRWWRKTPSKFQQLEAILNRQAILDSSPKPIPTVFADAKGYADSANAPDRVGRAEFDQLKSLVQREILARSAKARLAALEAKEARESAQVLMQHARSQFANSECANVTPAPVVPEVRVFRDISGQVFVCVGGLEVACRAAATSWEPPSKPWVTSWFDGKGYFLELHGPEKDAIVAEWRAWRGKQK